MRIFELLQSKLVPIATIPTLSAVPLVVTRPSISDLLFSKPDGTVWLLSHGVREIPIVLSKKDDNTRSLVIKLQDPVGSFATATLHDGSQYRIRLNLIPADTLTLDVCTLLSTTLPREAFYLLHYTFLDLWSGKYISENKDTQLDCLAQAIFKMLSPEYLTSSGAPSFPRAHTAAQRYKRDPALRKLSYTTPLNASKPYPSNTKPPHPYLTAVLHSLHLFAEDMRLNVEKHVSITRIAPIICRLAMVVRPEWADYWNRLCPGSAPIWPSENSSSAFIPRFPSSRLTSFTSRSRVL